MFSSPTLSSLLCISLAFIGTPCLSWNYSSHLDPVLPTLGAMQARTSNFSIFVIFVIVVVAVVNYMETERSFVYEGGNHHLRKEEDKRCIMTPSSSKRVLITGAAGFIGMHVGGKSHLPLFRSLQPGLNAACVFPQNASGSKAQQQ
jgi:hypothetical protein